MSASNIIRKGWDFSGLEDCIGYHENKSFSGKNVFDFFRSVIQACLLLNMSLV